MASESILDKLAGHKFYNIIIQYWDVIQKTNRKVSFFNKVRERRKLYWEIWNRKHTNTIKTKKYLRGTTRNQREENI